METETGVRGKVEAAKFAGRVSRESSSDLNRDHLESLINGSEDMSLRFHKA